MGGPRRRLLQRSLFEHPEQPRLRAERHFADLVEQHRPSFGRLEEPRPRLRAPLNAPRS